MKLQTTKIFKKIDEAYKAGCRIVSEQGGSRSSKTYNTMIWLIAYCMGHPNISVSVCRLTLPSIKRSVFRDFVNIMVDMQLYDPSRMNRSELIYTFPNNTFIEFFSCDNEQKLRGGKRDILFINEANEVDFLKFQQLLMRTTTFTILDYNPSFTDDHWLTVVNKRSDTKHFVTTYKDNPFLEQSIVQEIERLKGQNDSLWRIYGLGQQAQVEGLIFTKVEEVLEVPMWARKHQYIGIDFGYTHDPTAIVEVTIHDDDIYIREVCYQTQMLGKDIIDTIKEYQRRDKRQFEIISESADPRLIDEIANAGIDIKPVHKYQGSIMAGIQKMQSMKIKVIKDSPSVMKEFRNYTYRQNKDGKWLNEPIDAQNHAIDAIRYVVLEKLLGADNSSLTTQEIADILF